MTQIDRINGLIGSIAIKAPCRVATTANITLSGEQTIDGVSVVAEDRVLVKNQTVDSENGIYNCSTTSWTRSPDFNGTRDFTKGTVIRITEGTVNQKRAYEVTSSGVNIGVSSLTFASINFPDSASAFMETLLDDTSDAEARATLDVYSKSETASIAVNYKGSATGTADAITATLSPTLTSLADGTVVFLKALLANATTTPTFAPDGLTARTIVKEGSQALVAGDIARVDHELILRYNSANAEWELLNPSVTEPEPEMQSITGTVAASALTVGLNPTRLTFRGSTLTNGTTSTIGVTSALSLVVPSGATLGTIDAVQSRLILLAINNAGTVEPAIVNQAGGNNLDETTLISTTAIDATADSDNVIYSTAARTNVPFRVVGYLESTQATAGTWATAPSTLQGAGGNALTAMSSLGYGQNWQSVTRTSGTTYYNTTGKSIVLNLRLSASSTATVVIDGFNFSSSQTSASVINHQEYIIPPNVSYVITTTGTVAARELR